MSSPLGACLISFPSPSGRGDHKLRLSKHALGEKNRWSVGFSDQSEPSPGRFEGIYGLPGDSPAQPEPSPDGSGASTVCPGFQRTNRGHPRTNRGRLRLARARQGAAWGLQRAIWEVPQTIRGRLPTNRGRLRTVRWRLPNTLFSRGYPFVKVGVTHSNKSFREYWATPVAVSAAP